MSNAKCISLFLSLFYFLPRIIIQEARSIVNLSFYSGLRVAGERDLQMAN